MPFELDRLDSIFSAELEDREIISAYNLCVYDIEDTLINQTQHSKIKNRKQKTSKQEIDSSRSCIVYFENPAWLILKKMLLFLLCSILMLVLITTLLIYQLKIIAKQKQIEKIRRDFTDSMTHELRHPLQGALSMAEVLENPAFVEKPERRTNAVKRIKHNLANLSNLLDSIVQKSYSEKLQQVAEWKENDLREMLNDLMANFTLLSDKKITFVTYFENTKSTYRYDTVHFPNAIKNLIDNAIKYSNETVTIDISVKNNEKGFTVMVADNGIGIPKKELPHIFDKFYRIYGKKKNHGFGLGLSYVKWVADIHSGRVIAKSEKGEGSEFSISIPFVNETNT